MLIFLATRHIRKAAMKTLKTIVLASALIACSSTYALSKVHYLNNSNDSIAIDSIPLDAGRGMYKIISGDTETVRLSRKVFLITDTHKECSHDGLGFANGWYMSLSVDGQRIGDVCATLGRNIFDMTPLFDMAHSQLTFNSVCTGWKKHCLNYHNTWLKNYTYEQPYQELTYSWN